MKRLVVVGCIALGAVLGTLAGTHRAPAPEHARATALRDEVERLRVRFDAIKRELDAAPSAAAATAARTKLFQLRVDMVAVQDELAHLARNP